MNERVELPDGTFIEGPLLGHQMPRLYVEPDRHREVTEGCPVCAISDNGFGCGEQQAIEALEWAAQHGYEPDPWQDWYLRNLMSVKPNGKWAASDALLIVSRQNGKGTILEIRELAGLFCIGEKLIIHTAHQFKTSVNHFRRIKEVLGNYSSLSRQVKRMPSGNTEQLIELYAKPTLIFGSGSKGIRESKVGPTLEFHARHGASGSRGFSADCLVYDEGMILSDEQVGASMPTMSAMPNPQIILAGSAGLRDSFQMAKDRELMIKKAPDMLGAEWSGVPHNDSCPRSLTNGREKNDYIVCGKHDDRDDPRTVAKANPALGYRITLEFSAKELRKMPPKEYDRERLGMGEWPTDEEGWEVLDKALWESLSNTELPKPIAPIAFAADIDEDGKSATIVAAWRAKDGRVVLEIPRGCSQAGTDWVLPKLDELYRKWSPAANGLPKSGPGAAIIEDAKKKWKDRLETLGAGDEAAALAWFTQQAKAGKLWHFGEEKAPTLWRAVARASTRVVGDGGKAVSRRDSDSDITPFSAAIMAAYILNKRGQRSGDPLKGVAKASE